MTKWTIPDDLVGRLKQPWDVDRSVMSQTGMWMNQRREAAARIEALEAAIIAALRAPDESSSREILRKGLHGETTPPQG
jgi:hypothetical protein